jgi:hypothetical protein
MTSYSNSDSTEPEDLPGEETELRGDNPGVGGLPAKDVEITPDTYHEEDPEDEANRGDNPGVGGVPARDVGGNQ